MWKCIITISGWAFFLSAAPLGAHTPAAEGCGASAGEYAHELAIMRSAPTPISANGVLPASAMRLELGRRYAVSLAGQVDLEFRVPPARSSRAPAPRAGIFTFQTTAAGRYRVSLTSRHWVDLIDGDTVMESLRHFGPGCALVHKIVEFELAGGREITLQLSGREDAIVGLAITAAPAENTHAARH